MHGSPVKRMRPIGTSALAPVPSRPRPASEPNGLGQLRVSFFAERTLGVLLPQTEASVTLQTKGPEGSTANTFVGQRPESVANANSPSAKRPRDARLPREADAPNRDIGAGTRALAPAASICRAPRASPDGATHDSKGDTTPRGRPETASPRGRPPFTFRGGVDVEPSGRSQRAGSPTEPYQRSHVDKSWPLRFNLIPPSQIQLPHSQRSRAKLTSLIR